MDRQKDPYVALYREFMHRLNKLNHHNANGRERLGALMLAEVFAGRVWLGGPRPNNHHGNGCFDSAALERSSREGDDRAEDA